MRGGIDFRVRDLREGHALRRVEHAELEAGDEEAFERGVDLGLGDEALLDGVN